MGSSQSRSSNSHSRIIFHNTTRYTQGYNNISNNLISSDASCKQPKNAPRDGDTSSSENEGEELSNSSRYRPFSNYETSNSLDRSSRPEDNMTKTNEQESDLTCPQHFSDSDSLSDDSIVRPSDWVTRTYNYRRGRRVIDSSMNPEFGGQNVWRVRSQIEGTEAVGDTVGRRVMRRRSPVVESDDDSDSLSNTNNSEVLNPNESNQGVSRLSFMIGLSNCYTSGPTNNIRKRRRVNYSNNMNHDFGSPNVRRVRTNVEETEDDDISVSISQRVIGRRIPVVESEDDADSLSNTNNQGRIIPNEGDEVASSGLESNAINLSRRLSVFPSDDESNNISNYIERTIEREEESNTSDSDIRPRALSNRLAPIFQSDDSSFTSLSSSTESDDSIPIRNPRRRNRPIPIVDNDSEDIGNDLIGFDVNIKASTVMKVLSKNEVHNRNSSDTDTELETCPICLTAFKLQEIGKPISCDHKFCSLCIKEWAAKNNTCPVDRKVFNGIVVYDKIEGNIVCFLPVEKATPPSCYSIPPFYFEFEIIQEFPTDSRVEICSACGISLRPDRMISCDACNNFYHLGCVGMLDFPTINWYCSHCD